MKLYSIIQNYNNEKAIIINDENFCTYKKLIDQAYKFSKNLKKKKLILVLMDNEIETIISMIGSDIAENVIMAVNSQINQIALNELVKDYKPDYIFFNKRNKIAVSDYSFKCDFENYRLISNNINYKNNFNNELCMLISTSGSTGSKKQVMLTKKNLISNTMSIIKDLGVNSEDICITTLPPSYVYGMSIINTHLFSGAKILLNKSSVIEKEFWNKIRKFNVTNFGGVPYTYELIHKYFLKKENFQKIRYITQAGGFLSDKIKLEIITFLGKFHKKFITMYGAAEGTARLSYLPWESALKKNGSIGIAISGGNLSIVDTKGTEIKKPYQVGELVYKGENVFLGYSNSYKDLNNKKKNKNKLKTGDTAYRDKEKFYYLKGKLTRYIKVFGNRVNLDEIENIISKIKIKSVCVQRNKDMIHIFLNKKTDNKYLINYISKYTSLNSKVFKIITIKNFPLLENKKIDYKNKIFENE